MRSPGSKPLLTAGSLRVIGSTTHEEFKHIEKDRALARRLQKIAIDEPSIDVMSNFMASLSLRRFGHGRRGSLLSSPALFALVFE